MKSFAAIVLLAVFCIAAPTDERRKEEEEKIRKLENMISQKSYPMGTLYIEAIAFKAQNNTKESRLTIPFPLETHRNKITGDLRIKVKDYETRRPELDEPWKSGAIIVQGSQWPPLFIINLGLRKGLQKITSSQIVPTTAEPTSKATRPPTLPPTGCTRRNNGGRAENYLEWDDCPPKPPTKPCCWNPKIWNGNYGKRVCSGYSRTNIPGVHCIPDSPTPKPSKSPTSKQFYDSLKPCCWNPKTWNGNYGKRVCSGYSRDNIPGVHCRPDSPTPKPSKSPTSKQFYDSLPPCVAAGYGPSYLPGVHCRPDVRELNRSVVPTVTTDIAFVSSANFLVIGVASVMPFFLTFF